MLESVHEGFKVKTWIAPGYGRSLALMVVDADPFPTRTLFERVRETMEIGKVAGTSMALTGSRRIPWLIAQSGNAPRDRASELVTFLR